MNPLGLVNQFIINLTIKSSQWLSNGFLMYYLIQNIKLFSLYHINKHNKLNTILDLNQCLIKVPKS